MRFWTYGIWFAGSAVWLLVTALSLRSHSAANTLGDLALAIIFFAAGMFFARNENQKSRRR